MRLCINKESYWLEIFEGVEVKVKPLSTPLYNVAKSKVKNITKRIQEDWNDIHLLGGEVINMPDPTDEVALQGLTEFLFVTALASAAIEEWKGVDDEKGNPAPLNEDNVLRFMAVPNVAEKFISKYQDQHTKAVMEGKSSTIGANGTTAADHNIAKTAAKKDSNAPMENQG